MRKIGLICLALVLALGTMGVGYATWSQTLTITEGVNTGEFCMEFGRLDCYTSDPDCPPEGVVFPTDKPDRNGTLVWDAVNSKWTISTFTPVPGKNVACAEIAYGAGDDPVTLEITVNDGYPHYYAHFNFTVHNCGTIPSNLNKILVKECVSGDLIEEITYDGQIVLMDLDENGQDDVALWWGDNIGDQFDPCIDKDFSTAILILQDDGDTIQGGKFSFCVELVFDQWNYVP